MTTFYMFLSTAATPEGVSIPNAIDFSNYVVAAIPSKWKHVAIQLGLTIGTCKAIKKNEDECFDQFMAVFDEWEKGSCKPFTWSTLITALKSPSVAEDTLAETLKRKFCSSFGI